MNRLLYQQTRSNTSGHTVAVHIGRLTNSRWAFPLLHNDPATSVRRFFQAACFRKRSRIPRSSRHRSAKLSLRRSCKCAALPGCDSSFSAEMVHISGFLLITFRSLSSDALRKHVTLYPVCGIQCRIIKSMLETDMLSPHEYATLMLVKDSRTDRSHARRAGRPDQTPSDHHGTTPARHPLPLPDKRRERAASEHQAGALSVSCAQAVAFIRLLAVFVQYSPHIELYCAVGT